MKKYGSKKVWSAVMRRNLMYGLYRCIYGKWSQKYLKKKFDYFKFFKSGVSHAVRELFTSAEVEGVPVVEVGDLYWWPSADKIAVLAGVKLADGRYLVLGYDGGDFVIPLAAGNSWLINNLSEMPQLTWDDDHIDVKITEELSLMVRHGHEYGTLNPPYTWRFSGTTWSGDAALRKFEEHGLTFSAEVG